MVIIHAFDYEPVVKNKKVQRTKSKVTFKHTQVMRITPSVHITFYDLIDKDYITIDAYEWFKGGKRKHVTSNYVSNVMFSIMDERFLSIGAVKARIKKIINE